MSESSTRAADPVIPTACDLEPLPRWLEHELAIGRDKLPELRKAIIAAQLKCSGILHQDKINKEQGYKYSGHDDVVEHVRGAMASEGLSVEQVTCDLEAEVEIATKHGRSVAWKWRVICLVTHTSGASAVRIVRPLTVPNNKASFVASTSAERTLLMRLMRLAGTKDADPEGVEDPQQQQRGQGRAQQRGGAQEREGSRHVQQPPELSEADKAWLARRAGELPHCKGQGLMVLWVRVMRSRGLPKAAVATTWQAWEGRARELGLEPKELAEAARKLPPIAEDQIVAGPDGLRTDKQTGEVLT